MSGDPKKYMFGPVEVAVIPAAVPRVEIRAAYGVDPRAMPPLDDHEVAALAALLTSVSRDQQRAKEQR